VVQGKAETEEGDAKGCRLGGGVNASREVRKAPHTDGTRQEEESAAELEEGRREI